MCGDEGGVGYVGVVEAGDEFTVTEDGDFAGVSRDGGLVGDHGDGLSAGDGEVAEEFADAAGVGGVEVAGGLIGEDDVGVGDEGAGDGDALLLAAGEGIRAVAEAVGEFEVGHELAGFEVGGGAVAAVEHEGEEDVFFGGERGDEVEGLEDQADAAAAEEGEGFVGEGGEVGAGDEDVAGIGLGEAGHEVEEGAFARATGTHDGEEGSAADIEGDAGEGGDLAVGEGLHHVTNDERVGRGGCGWRWGGVGGQGADGSAGVGGGARMECATCGDI